ncbi:hypothetical protein GCM10017673_17660 [Streptosporangium violaceochromogenes]|nr:hypothetical protein GCM10017673_17660 [Streptosporangium violaceochromogenes]
MTVSETARGTRSRTAPKSATSTEPKTTARKTATRKSPAAKTAEKAGKATAKAAGKATETARKAVSGDTTRRATTAQQRNTAARRHGDGHDGHALTLNLPMMTVQFRPPHLHLPHVGMQEAGHAVDAAKSFLPPTERMVYYGGLGALAVAGLIEWPVAAAIGVGTMIAQRARGKSRPVRPAS